jgi:uncharacterized membrane protein
VATTSAAGVYPITVTGTSGALVESAAVTLTVSSAPTPAFVIDINSGALTATHGRSRTFSVQTVAARTFQQSITLSVKGLPTGVTAKFSPAAINGSGVSMLTLTAASTAKPATVSVTLGGTAGVTTHSTTVNLTVN